MKKILVALISIALFTWSCEKDISGPDEPTPPQNLTKVNVDVSNISEPTIWKKGNMYIIKDRIVRISSNLTIEPGTVIKFQNAGLAIDGGKIIASGTAQNPIIFTSYLDDLHGGDADGDGGTFKPEKGEWKGISIGSPGSVFEYCKFLYAGQSWNGYNAIFIHDPDGASVTFNYCTFAHTLYAPSGNAPYAFYAPVMAEPTVTKFTNNVFYDNGKPILLHANYTLNPNNKFHNPQKPEQTNSANGIYLTRMVNGTASWNHTEVAYVVDDWKPVYSSSTLNIGENVVVKFSGRNAGLSRDQPQNINISPSAVLTSYRDDSYKGDSNGDGNASSPVKGDWRGVYTSSKNGYESGANILFSTN